MHIATKPVLPDTDTGTPDQKPMAGIGDNNPPAFDQSVLDRAVKNFDEFMAANKVWLDLTKITTEDQSSKATDMVQGYAN